MHCMNIDEQTVDSSEDSNQRRPTGYIGKIHKNSFHRWTIRETELRLPISQITSQISFGRKFLKNHTISKVCHANERIRP